MKEVRVIVKIKNNRLVSEREALGLSQAKLAELCGVNMVRISSYESLREYPVLKNGEWNDAAFSISSFFKKEPEYLFPEALTLIKVNRAQREISITECLNGSSAPLLLTESHENSVANKEAINKMLKSLKPRESAMLKLAFGFNGPEMSLAAIADRYGISAARIMQIVNKSIRKLRHPSRAKGLMGKFDQCYFCGKVLRSQDKTEDGLHIICSGEIKKDQEAMMEVRRKQAERELQAMRLVQAELISKFWTDFLNKNGQKGEAL